MLVAAILLGESFFGEFGEKGVNLNGFFFCCLLAL